MQLTRWRSPIFPIFVFVFVFVLVFVFVFVFAFAFVLEFAFAFVFVLVFVLAFVLVLVFVLRQNLPWKSSVRETPGPTIKSCLSYFVLHMKELDEKKLRHACSKEIWDHWPKLFEWVKHVHAEFADGASSICNTIQRFHCLCRILNA